MRGLGSWIASRCSDPSLAESIMSFETHTHTRWTYDIRSPAMVEPRAGYVFPRPGLVERSFAYWHMRDGPSGGAMLEYLRWLGGARDLPHYAVALSFRDAGETNYWHFHDDVLGKLALADDLGLPSATPVLVAPELWNTSWFAGMRSSTALGERNWVLHDRPVRTDRLIVCHPGSLRRANALYALETLSPAASEADGTAGRPELVYLTRGRGRRRHVLNDDELAARLASQGFARIDADELPCPEQVALFRAARCVVLVHGAGLVNLVHRIGRPTAVVEVFPGDYAAPHLAWMAREFGFEYRAVRGDRRTEGEGFRVDVLSVGAAADEVLAALSEHP